MAEDNWSNFAEWWACRKLDMARVVTEERIRLWREKIIRRREQLEQLPEHPIG